MENCSSLVACYATLHPLYQSIRPSVRHTLLFRFNGVGRDHVRRLIVWSYVGHRRNIDGRRVVRCYVACHVVRRRVGRSVVRHHVARPGRAKIRFPKVVKEFFVTRVGLKEILRHLRIPDLLKRLVDLSFNGKRKGQDGPE